MGIFPKLICLVFLPFHCPNLFDLPVCNISCPLLSNRILDSRRENNLTDQDLVSRVLHGDTRAFGVIVKQTERLVAQIVFKMVSGSETRKDIAQDVYLKAFKSLSTFKFQSKLSTWIARIAYTTCLNYLEKGKTGSFSSVFETKLANGESADHLENSLSSQSENDVEALIFQKQLSEILKIEIGKLPPLYQTLIILFHQEELTYSEIAQITELPEGTLKSYLFRARKALKDSLLLNYKREAL
jgi:RNA polymerase sigma factor (sigma-70 family)